MGNEGVILGKRDFLMSASIAKCPNIWDVMGIGQSLKRAG
jgi:hypothetical protein